MNKVLIVEDSRFISEGLRSWIAEYLHFEADVARSFQEAKALTAGEQLPYFVALIDLNLPDAPEGQAVDYMLSRGIGTIVVTGSYDDTTRRAMMAKGIVDYVVKRHPNDVVHLLKLIRRIHNNHTTKILLVDDSPGMRRYFRKLLLAQRLQVLEAENGVEALKVIEANPDITLMLTDFHMPVMDGYALVQEVRKQFHEDCMAIMVLSQDEDKDNPPRFLKAGANDFVRKTATIDEFICRLNMNLFAQDLLAEIRDKANRDYLTNLFNRRYFFQTAKAMCAEDVKACRSLAVAMIDIDHFKRVNDTHGHEAGDEVIKSVADRLERTCGPLGLVARFGGEEFCVLLRHLPATGAPAFFEDFRDQVANSTIRIAGRAIRVTVSIGVALGVDDTLEELLREADTMLYQAKNAGRDQVRVSG